ncbi:MAG: hypothetical protein AAGI38_17130, partial [Bacteroidota bacterium]
MKVFLAIWLAAVPLLIQAQATKLPVQKVSCEGITDPLSPKNDWTVRLKNSPLPSPSSAIEEIKEAPVPEIPTNKTHVVSPPTYITGFSANTNNIGNPNDNDLAISKDGIIVSVVNINIAAFDTTGEFLLDISLNGLFSGVGTGNKFDPRVLYDPNRDRFIITCLDGLVPSTSTIRIAFSSTNDPRDPWFTYGLEGNVPVTGVPVWSDYPQIGLTKDELLLTTNLFDEEPEAQGAVVYQIELDSAFAGKELTVQPHYLRGTFSLCPVLGATEPLGPPYYFVDNVGRGADNKIVLHQLTNTIRNGGAFSTPATLTSQLNYSLSPPAVQAGSPLR